MIFLSVFSHSDKTCFFNSLNFVFNAIKSVRSSVSIFGIETSFFLVQRLTDTNSPDLILYLCVWLTEKRINISDRFRVSNFSDKLKVIVAMSFLFVRVQR